MKLIHVSVFGKQSVKEIEKDLIIQLFEVFNTLKRVTDNNIRKIGTNIAQKLAERFTGINFNLSDLIENVSIETVSQSNSNKRIILCIDDVERKPDSIPIKDLLGLVERASTNFNVIIIANISKLNNDELESFNDYKEKIVDYEFSIDCLDMNILEEICLSKMPYITTDQLKKIVQIYSDENSIHIDFNNNTITTKRAQVEKSNIRIYKKFIELIKLVNDQATDILGQVDVFVLDNNIITLCKNVIYHYYFDNENGNKEPSGANYDKLTLFREVQKIFKYEDFDHSIVREYFLDETEISRDIRILHKIYELNKSELQAMLEKISHDIINSNYSYFVGQKQIVSLSDVLNELGMLREFREKLLEIANNMYNPEIDQKPPYIDSEDWSDVDYYGMVACSQETFRMIKAINKINREKHEAFLLQKFNEALERNDISILEKIVKTTRIDNLNTFESIFTIAFEKIKDQFNFDTWKFIYLLIDRTESSVIKNFFIERAKNETDLLLKKRYKQLNDVLAEKMYFETEAERNQEYPDE
ncbi:hypothetical protein [Paenibacillus lactis]|uniref:hypothetical protein n=1 Tax=Paenibacillus lactis TaxID=228574 RepID=UPI0011A6D4F2